MLLNKDNSVLLSSYWQFPVWSFVIDSLPSCLTFLFSAVFLVDLAAIEDAFQN